MSFVEHLENEIAGRRPECAVCRWYVGLDVDNRAQFDAAVDILLKDSPFGFKTAMFRAAKKLGLQAGDDSFARHLNEHHGELRRKSE